MPEEALRFPDEPGLKLGATGDGVRAIHRVLASYGYVTIEEAEAEDDDVFRSVPPSIARTLDAFTEVSRDALKQLQWVGILNQRAWSINPRWMHSAG